MSIEVVPTRDYTERAVAYLAETIRQRDKAEPFHLFLSGGSTPKPIYRGLAEAGLDWENVHFWLGDERYVPWDHPDSNYRMVREALLEPAKIAPERRHPWPILATPELSGETYDREFRSIFERDGQRLNLQILGMGDDGHTASLFPGSPAIQEREAMCVSNLVHAQEKNRLTLTFPALALSEEIVFLIKGENKAEVLKEVFEQRRAADGEPSELYPTARVNARGATVFFLDEAAAAKLPEDTNS